MRQSASRELVSGLAPPFADSRPSSGPTGGFSLLSRTPAAFTRAPPPCRMVRFYEERRMDLGLRGKTAVITGGSRGIGRAVAEAFASEGANVSICARKGEEVAAVVRTLEARGVRAWGQALDVADAAALSAWVTASAG